MVNANIGKCAYCCYVEYDESERKKAHICMVKAQNWKVGMLQQNKV